MRRKLLGDEHPSTLLSIRNLVDVLKAEGKTDETRPLAAELLAHQRRLAEKPNARINDINAYAWALLTIEPADLRDPAAALPMAQKAVEKSGGKNPGIMDTLALAQQMSDDIDAAVETERNAIAFLPEGPSALRAAMEQSLATYLIEQGSFPEAEPLLLALHQQLEDNPKSPTKTKQESIERIIQLYEAWHSAKPGMGYDTKAAQWRAKLPKVEPKNEK